MLPLLLLLGIGGGAYALTQREKAERRAGPPMPPMPPGVTPPPGWENFPKEDSAKWLKSNAGQMLTTPQKAAQASFHFQNLGFPMLALLTSGGIDPSDLKVEAPWAIKKVEAEMKAVKKLLGI